MAEGFAAKDLARSVAFCDEQASMLVPNAPIATGKRAVAKLIAMGFALQDYKLAWQPNRVAWPAPAKLGYTSGTYKVSFKHASGKTISDKAVAHDYWCANNRFAGSPTNRE